MQILEPFMLFSVNPNSLKFSHFPSISNLFSPRDYSSKTVLKADLFSGFLNSTEKKTRVPTNFGKCRRLVMVNSRVSVEDGNDKDDNFYIKRCVELATKAIGFTSPNPMVGCVIVKDGKIVGQGFHPKAGQPHAEVFALRDAGDLAENATAYVSLEPCNHYGRTPPCTEALIKAKVKKVVVGMVDPNPLVASKGLDRLRGAGIDVVVGVEEEMCRKLNEAFIHLMLTGKPYLTLRHSISMNGQLLNQLGEGVTENGGYYSQFLQEYDAVIVSSSLTGNLALPTSQEPGANQPIKIIIAKNPCPPVPVSIPSNEVASKVILFTDKDTSVEQETTQKGFETVVLDHINLDAILEFCKRRGLCSVLLDLRGNFGELEDLVKEGIEQNMLQKIVVEVLPLWVDSEGGGNSLKLLNSVRKRLQVSNLQSKASGKSIVLEGYVQ
ncbi:hypothetical protein K2173_013326 [Erythroxylum novogranatense]|uniref:Riboflavin biosynthesis protein PYRD, chloroplastic n=1 Tax=Erythroxylum novogranatense TaxID=1862640 RepID=A0AAV8SA29_9ROSI|nr:hypothetical protein K2173_013326 [Erythroxylum novogranatense]